MAFVVGSTYHGDITASDIIDFKFTSMTAAIAPATLAGTPAVSVYKSNSTTQSTAGITLTADFDSVTGLNHVRIDTSADAFYATNTNYQVVVTAGTVSGESLVGSVVGHFSIGNREVDPDSLSDITDIVGAVELSYYTSLLAVLSAAFAALPPEIISGIQAVSLTGSQMADYVLRRNSANARASADGDGVNFRSLLGAVSRLTNKSGVSGTDLVTREEDDTTAFGTQAITSDAAADPITVLDGGS